MTADAAATDLHLEAPPVVIEQVGRAGPYRAVCECGQRSRVHPFISEATRDIAAHADNKHWDRYWMRPAARRPSAGAS